MFGITVSEAAALCGGFVYGKNEYDPEIRRLVIDSREVKKDDLFLAYKGEKTDGHDFILSALEKGAAAALAEHFPVGFEKLTSGAVIVCEDVQKAAETITAEFRKKVDVPVIGITGSVGKTSTKEMIASVLNEHFRICKTEGNLNNTIGVPLSLCSLQKDDEVAVIEMGINHFGEMRRLGRMVIPDIAVFTVIGHAHLEFLGDLNGVLKAKTEMLEFMSDDALLIVNGDDPLLCHFSCPQMKMTYGKSEECDVYGSDIAVHTDGFISFKINYSGKTLPVVIPGFGEHLVYAALAAAAVGFAMGMSDEEIMQGIAQFKTVGRRLSVENTGFVRLVDDCYNSNPDSCKSSIDTLLSLPGRHVCILGDMLELGKNSEHMHSEIGSYAAEKGIDLLLTCGDLAFHMSESFRSAIVPSGSNNETTVFHYPDMDSMISDLSRVLSKEDAVLVKASRGAHLERVSEAIKLLGAE